MEDLFSSSELDSFRSLMRTVGLAATASLWSWVSGVTEQMQGFCGAVEKEAAVAKWGRGGWKRRGDCHTL